MDILEFDGIVYNTDTIIEDAKKLETVEEQVIYVKREINKIDKFDQYDLCDYLNFEEGDPVAKRLHNSFIDFIKDRRNFIKELSSELEKLKGSNKKGSIISSRPVKKKFAKHYALYHAILIEMGKEVPFDKTEEGTYSRSEIEEFVGNRYHGVSKQGFYKAFLEINLKNKITVAKSFGKGYKDVLEGISNNNAQFISHIRNYPN